MYYQVPQDEGPVPDGRLRVENFEFMQTFAARSFEWLRIDANDNCNLKCTYCRIPRSSKLIDAEAFERFMHDKVIDVESLQFGCGMEPTIDSRMSDLMLVAARSPAKPTARFVVQTNGTKLHKQDHEKMVRAGLTRLSVSIDSMDEEVHAFQRGGSSVQQIISNLQDFRRNCPDVEIQFICVVTKESVAGCEELADFAIQLGVVRLAFREMVFVPGDRVTDPKQVQPLVVPRGEFEAMTNRVKTGFGNRGTYFDFYPTQRLHEHRAGMRKASFPDDQQGPKVPEK